MLGGGGGGGGKTGGSAAPSSLLEKLSPLDACEELAEPRARGVNCSYCAACNQNMV